MILQLKGWTFGRWDAMYADRPSRQAKLAVADRTVIECVADETRLVRPVALQVALDDEAQRCGGKIVGGGGARCFVRPSGTEDVVRVYAEAATQAAADALALAALRAAHRHAGGLGPPPERIADA
ncbi:unnamed protein product [Phaeothamnion confervicola]